MEHSNTALLHCVHLAGSQVNLAAILDVHTTQLSAWLLNPKINMPVKYAFMIENWTNGRITLRNLYPELQAIPKAPILDPYISIEGAISSLIKQANTNNVPVYLNVTVGDKVVYAESASNKLNTEFSTELSNDNNGHELSTDKSDFDVDTKIDLK